MSESASGIKIENSLVKIDLGKVSDFGTKLVETVKDVVSAVFAPSQIRRIALAEADAKRIHALADAETAAFDVLPEKTRELQARALNRLLIQETTRQQNIEAIINEAPNYAPETISSDPVEPDWLAAFLESSQDISDEQVRTLWAKILASEIGQPGCISRRLLNTVRLMSKSDAVAFETLCRQSFFGHVCGVDEHPEQFVFSSTKTALGRAAFEPLAQLGLIAHEDINNGFHGTQVADATFFGSEVEFYKTSSDGGFEGAMASLQETICSLTITGRELLDSLKLKRPDSLPEPLVEHFARVYRITLRYRYG